MYIRTHNRSGIFKIVPSIGCGDDMEKILSGSCTIEFPPYKTTKSMSAYINTSKDFTVRIDQLPSGFTFGIPELTNVTVDCESKYLILKLCMYD